MNSHDYRHRAAALWFLSSISLDGSSCDIYKTNRRSRGHSSQGYMTTVEDVDDDDKSRLEFTPEQRASASNSKSDPCEPQKSTDFPARKNVCFGEIIMKNSSKRQCLVSNNVRSISTTSGPPYLKNEPSTNSDSESLRFAFSTVSQRRLPIVVASVIPLSRDPLLQSGIPKSQNGTQTGGATGGGSSCSSGRQRSVPEMPVALLNTLFRHNTGANAAINSTTNNYPRSGSLGHEDNLPTVKPLSYSKPVGSIERSFAHFLVPRKSLQHQSLNPKTHTNRPGCHRRRAETVAGNEVLESDKSPSMSPPTAARSGEQYRSRPHTLSLSSMVSALSRPDKNSSPPQEGAPFVWILQSVDSPMYPSSSENTEPSQALVYDDPLINYDPLLLDDPMVPRVNNRRVFPFHGYMTSILGYRRADEHKKSINREFHQRFPNVQLTLTKMRSIKLNLLAIALRMNLDLWIVAHAYVLFEKMILKLFVCKANRKLCAGAALLISAKLNDLKGPSMPIFIQGIESEFRISHRDLIHMEMAVFIGLEFCVLPSPSEALPHFMQIQKSLGVVVATPRYLPIPTRTHSLDDDNFRTSVLEQ